MAGSSVRPAWRAASRRRARSSASSCTDRTVPFPADEDQRARLRAAGRADRAASARAPRPRRVYSSTIARRGDVRHRRFSRPSRRAARRRPRRRQRHPGRAGAPAGRAAGRVAPPSCSCSSVATGRSGRRSRVRRDGCDRGSASTAGRNAELLETLGGGRWLVRLEGEPAGETPLPPYIRSRSPIPSATRPSTRATRAPPPRRPRGCTSPRSCSRAARPERVTLHVGLDTFRPVTAKHLSERIPSTASATACSAGRWERIRGRPAGRRGGDDRRPRRSRRSRAAGRSPGGRSCSSTPGFEFRCASIACSRNFHLPRSTLLALVMAFAGVERDPRAVPRSPMSERYRFYSFGDAMLVL